ncbi:MAG TPA: DUF1697 domain-containing protein [Chthoniobacterales bacterium]
MPRFIAFLRAINVGGRTVTMAALRVHFEALPLVNVETFIASGNVIFEAESRDPAALERRIESHLFNALGYEVSTFLRTDVEIAAITHYRPFTERDMASAVAFNVAFVAEPLDAAASQRVAAFKTDIDDFHVHGREVYWLCRKKQSDSTFSNKVFEKAIEMRATFRGMNTIKNLAARFPLTAFAATLPREKG